ncbi:hypothetical protein N2152v2_003393 [Parachlorella kessleri]
MTISPSTACPTAAGLLFPVLVLVALLASLWGPPQLLQRQGSFHWSAKPPQQRALLTAEGGSREPPYKARYLAYPWALPVGDRRRGLVYRGSGKQLEHVAGKLLAGQPITAVAIGGSITAGMGSMGREFAWPGRFRAWLNATFPHPGHVVVNKGVGATTSGLFALCLDTMLAQQDVDLVIVEFSWNDVQGYTDFGSPDRKGFEQLLRKLLRHPSQPSLLLLHFYVWLRARYGTSLGGIYWEGSAETQLALFGQYYDIPSVSLRAGAYHLMRRGVGNFKADKPLVPDPGVSSESGKPGEAFYFDYGHPTDFGHGVSGLDGAGSERALGMERVMAELVGEALYEAVVNLESERGSASQERKRGAGTADGNSNTTAAATDDRLMPAAEVPPPMVPGNAESGPSTCFLQEGFKGVVSNASGFTYVAAKPSAATFTAQKWSWSGTQPGHWAELTFDAREDPTRSQESDASLKATRVILGYLKSYESMGSAAVECVNGCECERTTLDGTWARKATLFQMHEFEVTQHPTCRLKVTVLPETRSGAHKVSLTFLMVSPFPVAHELRHFGEEHANGLVSQMVS